jgi:hypothetical protein
VVRNWAVKLKLILTLWLVSKITFVQTDTLYQTLGKKRLLLIVNIKNLILD